MIVFDTNVWSELTKVEPDPHASAWILQHEHEASTTAVNVAELWFGVHRLPAGRRRDGLATKVGRLVELAQDRVLPFDEEAAHRFAQLRADAERAGRRLARLEDPMIAAICLVHGLAVATRNVTDFEGFGLTVINPWTDS